jgi:hypothetical protein
MGELLPFLKVLVCHTLENLIQKLHFFFNSEVKSSKNLVNNFKIIGLT